MSPDSSAYDAALSRLLASPTRPKFGLRRMEALCAALDNPHRVVPVLHIAGTKGKGSTAAMAASMLRASGMRVGLTTSPHLLCARERIVIDGALIDEARFAHLEALVDTAASTLDPALDVPSFFERLVAMAFCAFANVDKDPAGPVDVAVVEVGLGGRLDATNVVHPRACAITPLGLDHTEFLGPTLEDIAREKAGILKRDVPAVTAPQHPEALAVLQAVANDVGASVTVVEVHQRALQPALRGAHQAVNAAVAVALVQAAGYALSDDAITRGLHEVRWPARYETVSESPLVIIDGAHDTLAFEALREAVIADPRLTGRLLHLVLGFSAGHDPAEVLRPLHGLSIATATATSAVHPRALPASTVALAAVETLGLRASSVDRVADVSEALLLATTNATNDGGVVIVTGSLFVAGEARGVLVPMPRDDARPVF